jgi:hypothetical protein
LGLFLGPSDLRLGCPGSNLAFNSPFLLSSFVVVTNKKKKEKGWLTEKRPNTSVQEVSLQIRVSFKDSVM